MTTNTTATTVRRYAGIIARAESANYRREDHAETGMRAAEIAARLAKLSGWQKTALEFAYTFAGKAPRQERADLQSYLFSILLDKGEVDRALAYTIARQAWQDWYRAYVTRQSVKAVGDLITEDTALAMGVNSLAMADMSNSCPEYAELAGEELNRQAERYETKSVKTGFWAIVEYENRMVSELDARALWSALPDRIRDIAIMRQNKQALTRADQKHLERWLKTDEARDCRALVA